MTAWVLRRIPWLSAMRRLAAEDDAPAGEVVTLASWATCAVDVRRRRSAEIECVSGQLLVTFEGDPVDHIVSAGERFRVNGRGRLVVAALQPSRVAIREPRREARARGGAPARGRSGARAPRLAGPAT